MSWLDGVTNQVLREDIEQHCDHRGIIFCVTCKEENCADRMAKSSKSEPKRKEKK